LRGEVSVRSNDDKTDNDRVDNERPSEFLLRAEIRAPKETVVSYARELTKQWVFVVTDWNPPLDTKVLLALSFPSVFEPVEVHARVSERRPSRGVGNPAGLRFEFEFDAPLTREAIATLARKISEGSRDLQPARTSAYRVLLVEDNALIRDLFSYGIGRFMSERQGKLEFHHAPDAASAWKLLDDGEFDLLIVDYYLPLEDGAAFIARLRKDQRFARSPVLAISIGGRDAREATLTAGADLFLDKPIVMRDLVKTLQVLSQKGAAP
jgi:CheY-like chemotaxis protein